jgi:hypothetical protein
MLKLILNIGVKMFLTIMTLLFYEKIDKGSIVRLGKYKSYKEVFI